MTDVFSHQVNPESNETIIGRVVPLRDCRTPNKPNLWKGEPGFALPDYDPKIPPGDVLGVIPGQADMIAIDIDPKKIPTARTDWSNWLDEPDAENTTGQMTPHDGDHQVYLVPPHLRGRIKQGTDKPIPGVDIIYTTFIKTGEGYEWNCPTGFAIGDTGGSWWFTVYGEVKPMPRKLVEYFEKQTEPRPALTLIGNEERPPSKTHVSPAMYMNEVEPDQDFNGWRKQCDSLIAGGASIEEVLAWCSRGGKFDAYGDRAIIEGSIRKGLGITSGWFATDYYRKEGMDVPKMGVADNGQWRRSEERNKRERIKHIINQDDVFNMFMRFGLEVEEIVSKKETDVRTVRRWLKSSSDRYGNPPLTSYVTALPK